MAIARLRGGEFADNSENIRQFHKFRVAGPLRDVNSRRRSRALHANSLSSRTGNVFRANSESNPAKTANCVSGNRETGKLLGARLIAAGRAEMRDILDMAA
jgi:hypothetical protein